MHLLCLGFPAIYAHIGFQIRPGHGPTKKLYHSEAGIPSCCQVDTVSRATVKMGARPAICSCTGCVRRATYPPRHRINSAFSARFTAPSVWGIHLRQGKPDSNRKDYAQQSTPRQAASVSHPHSKDAVMRANKIGASLCGECTVPRVTMNKQRSMLRSVACVEPRCETIP